MSEKTPTPKERAEKLCDGIQPYFGRNPHTLHAACVVCRNITIQIREAGNEAIERAAMGIYWKVKEQAFASGLDELSAMHRGREMAEIVRALKEKP